MRLARPIEFKSHFDIARAMDRKEYDLAIASGEQFVIIDNLVVDVRLFID